MTHSEAILDFLKRSGGEATLGELLDVGRFSFAHKLTARISDLRKQGHQIVCIEGPNPSKNIYKLIPPTYQFKENDNQGFLFQEAV